MAKISSIAGSLIGGAVGDALGAPIEFLSLVAIRQRFGEAGIVDYSPAYNRLGALTDDTQMTLFTAEGLLRAYVRANNRGVCNIPGVVSKAYLRWLETQEKSYAERDKGTIGWLYHIPELWAVRAPGRTCLSALQGMRTGLQAKTDSKGAGGIMRIGPVAMMFASREDKADEVFDIAMECALLTHGHPSGFLSAAAFSVILHAVLCEKPMKNGVDIAKTQLMDHPGHEQVLQAIDAALRLSGTNVSNDDAIRELGEAWVGDEALGVALFCALRATDFENGLRIAVNHDGDSDTTGTLVGQLLGAKYGLEAIPNRWLEGLELREVLMTVATDIYEHESWNFDEHEFSEKVFARYPGI